MTLEDVAEMTQETITADTVGKIVGCDPQYIRDVAKEDRSQLGFPVIVTGKRVRIPRRPFLEFMGWRG